MARDRDNPGHAANRPALPGLELAPESHHRKHSNDRVRETLPAEFFREAIRSVPARRNPRPDGGVNSLFDKGRKKSENRSWPLFRNPFGTILLRPGFQLSEVPRLPRFKSRKYWNLQRFFVVMHLL